MELTISTLPALLLKRAADSGDRTILRRKDHGVWKSISWAALARSARDIGGALKAAGVRQGDLVAILSETCPEWVYADLAVMGLGAVSLGCSTSDTAGQTAQSLRDCNCAVVFAENEEQLDKLLAIQGECPALRQIIVFDVNGLHDLDNPMVTSLAAFTANVSEVQAGAWHDDVRMLDPKGIATLMFTAGTTGPAKGVYISHGKLMAQASNGAAMLKLTELDERVAFLPMSHVFERVVGLYQSLVSDTISNYVESLETVSDNFREIQPTVVGLMPRTWRRMRATIALAADEASFLQKSSYHWALGVGARYSVNKNLSLGLRLQYCLADLFVLGRIRRRMGLGRARMAFCAMASMPVDLLEWYRAIGVDMRLAYTVTEGIGLVSMLPSKEDSVSVISLAGGGEILLPDCQTFDNYLDGQSIALNNGLFATGDMGIKDESGITVVGRGQYLLQISDNDVISAAVIETALCASPFIADALVSRDDGGRLAAVLLIDHEAMERWAQAENVTFTGFTALMRSQKARDHILQEVAAINAGLPPMHCVGTVKLIERRVEPGDAELTTAMTLRRTLITDHAEIAGEIISCSPETL